MKNVWLHLRKFLRIKKTCWLKMFSDLIPKKCFFDWNTTSLKKTVFVKQNRFLEFTKYFFLLAGHKVDFIAPYVENKSVFWPPGKKIVYIYWKQNLNLCYYKLFIIEFLLSKSESVKFSLIESVICLFTDSAVKKNFHC